MQRYFVKDIVNDEVIFEKDQIHHIVNVMRMRVNDQVTIVYNGEAFLAALESTTPLKVKISHHGNSPLKISF